MFVSPASLPHILSPRAYFDPVYHLLDCRVLRQGWHPVATESELATSGDFLTTDVAGVPVQVRNFDGQLRALSNICAHRHCLVSSASRGHSERMRCQYHGWEYQADGRTGRIPEPKNFVPFDRDRLRLPQFRLEQVGQLVFVSVAEDPPSLAEFLGHDFYQLLGERFGQGWLPTLRWQPELDANWKVPVENSLEAYHVPSVGSSRVDLQACKLEYSIVSPK